MCQHFLVVEIDGGFSFLPIHSPSSILFYFIVFALQCGQYSLDTFIAVDTHYVNIFSSHTVLWPIIIAIMYRKEHNRMSHCKIKFSTHKNPQYQTAARMQKKYGFWTRVLVLQQKNSTSHNISVTIVPKVKTVDLRAFLL